MHDHAHHRLPVQPSAEERDPVCGMQVGPDTPYRFRYQGKEYLFCAAGCRDRFARDPGKYLSPAPAPAVTPANVEWTCPMHPQIVRQAPGSCPICGMALEQRTVSAEEPVNPELV